MVLLSVVVGFVGILSLLNLAFTAAVVRRLREHERTLAGYATMPVWPSAPLRAVGERIDSFEMVTVDGDRVARETLADGTLVGFFDPDCDACHEQLPGFLASARVVPGGRSATLAVVGGADGADDLVGQLRRVARVVVDSRGGQVQRAFGVQMFPAFCRLGVNQVIAAHGYETDDVAAVSR
jgi:hypothetical protein